MKLTHSRIEKANYEGKKYEKNGRVTYQRCVHWDDDCPGFGIRITPAGEKAFVLCYRNAQRRSRVFTIGPYGVLTLQEARNRARRLLAQILEGGDPLSERSAARAGAMVRELFDTYLERHAKDRKKSWETDGSYIRRFVVKAWGNRKAASITRADVAKLHHEIGHEQPHTANRVVALISKAYGLAAVWGIVPETYPNPAHGIEKYPEKSRERWVTARELPALLDAIGNEENPYIRGVLALYLLTGARKNELLAAKWEDVDFDAATLRIPKTKNGRAHSIPLSGPALEILSNLPRLDGNPHVFPGAKTGGRLVNLNKNWAAIRKAANMPDLRIHDLRRTVGSWLAVDGTSLLIIGRALNHRRSSSTEVYARLSDDPVRHALEKHGRKIEAVLKKRTPAEVTDAVG